MSQKAIQRAHRPCHGPVRGSRQPRLPKQAGGKVGGSRARRAPLPVLCQDCRQGAEAGEPCRLAGPRLPARPCGSSRCSAEAATGARRRADRAGLRSKVPRAPLWQFPVLCRGCHGGAEAGGPCRTRRSKAARRAPLWQFPVLCRCCRGGAETGQPCRARDATAGSGNWGEGSHSMDVVRVGCRMASELFVRNVAERAQYEHTTTREGSTIDVRVEVAQNMKFCRLLG